MPILQRLKGKIKGEKLSPQDKARKRIKKSTGKFIKSKSLKSLKNQTKSSEKYRKKVGSVYRSLDKLYESLEKEIIDPTFNKNILDNLDNLRKNIKQYEETASELQKSWKELRNLYAQVGRLKKKRLKYSIGSVRSNKFKPKKAEITKEVKKTYAEYVALKKRLVAEKRELNTIYKRLRKFNSKKLATSVEPRSERSEELKKSKERLEKLEKEFPDLKDFDLIITETNGAIGFQKIGNLIDGNVDLNSSDLANARQLVEQFLDFIEGKITQEEARALFGTHVRDEANKKFKEQKEVRAESATAQSDTSPPIPPRISSLKASSPEEKLKEELKKRLVKLEKELPNSNLRGYKLKSYDITRGLFDETIEELINRSVYLAKFFIGMIDGVLEPEEEKQATHFFEEKDIDKAKELRELKIKRPNALLVQSFNFGNPQKQFQDISKVMKRWREEGYPTTLQKPLKQEKYKPTLPPIEEPTIKPKSQDVLAQAKKGKEVFFKKQQEKGQNVPGHQTSKKKPPVAPKPTNINIKRRG